MFLLLLGVTFLVALAVCFVVTRLFARPIGRVLNRIVGEDLAGAWATYLTFAIYVVGISGGVHLYHLETVLHQTSGYSVMAPDEPRPCGALLAGTGRYRVAGADRRPLGIGDLPDRYRDAAVHRPGAAAVLCLCVDCLCHRAGF